MTFLDFRNLGAFAVLFLALFAGAEYVYQKRSRGEPHGSERQARAAETTRKIVHVGSGIGALCFPWVFEHILPVVLLCSGFIVLLAVTKRRGWLLSIHGVGRYTWGAQLFPVSVSLLFALALFLDDWSYYYLPLAALAFADPAAAMVGKRFPFGPFNVGNQTKKTVAGALACFFVCGLVLTIGPVLSGHTPQFSQVWVPSLFAAIGEVIGVRGSDNVTLPLGMGGGMWMVG